ncbi:MAG: hypothetical protein AB8H79_00635 [Myxococcota bacterium]
MRSAVALMSVVMMTACAGHHLTADSRPCAPYRFEGTPTLGEIRVVPLLRAYDAPALRADGYVTAGIPDARLAIRSERMRSIQRVPEALATALPGAIHSRLGDDWSGHFRVGHLSSPARNRIESALRRDDLVALEAAMGTAAIDVGGRATLFVWLTELHADPLTAEGFPGDRIQTASGTVVVDFKEEPYRVRAEVGTALVDADGHVVLRYVDRGESLLSPHRSSGRVGRDLAGDLAEQVAKMWPDDPRLWNDNAIVSSDPEPWVDLKAQPSRKVNVPFQGLRDASDRP